MSDAPFTAPFSGCFKQHMPPDRCRFTSRSNSESKAATLASTRATNENFDRLQEFLDLPQARLDRGFHLEILRVTKNSVFYDIFSTYCAMGIPCLPIYYSDRAHGHKSHAEHIQIHEAVRRRDGNLAQVLMNAHVQGAERY